MGERKTWREKTRERCREREIERELGQRKIERGKHREGERGNTGIERDIYRRRKRKKD